MWTSRRLFSHVAQVAVSMSALAMMRSLKNDSVQLRVLCFGMLQDWNIKVGAFHNVKKFSNASFGFCRLSRKSVSARHSQVKERIDQSPVGMAPIAGAADSLMTRDLSELGHSFRSSA